MPLQLFDNILKGSGFPIDKARDIYALLLQQQPPLHQRKQAIVDHHLHNNPFYRSLVQQEPTNWNRLPVLTKRDLQQPLHQRLSNTYTRKNTFTGKTSGSSGHPFTFAKDRMAHAITWAAFDHAYQQHGIDLNRSLQARFYGIPLSGMARYKELCKDYVSNRVRFPVFNLNDQVLETFVHRFKKQAFQYINGYTSSIVLLAQYCRKKNVILNQLCPSLTACIVTSEMLFADDRLLLEQWLGVPIINEYGASEVGLIAIENPKGELILNQENLFVEVVDDHNQPVPDGELGRILVTDLYNLAHPMIRYEIGDIGSIKHLENGHKILDKLQGRTSDIARLPSGKVVPGLTFYYVTKAVINEDINILEFMVIQRELALFEIQYVGPEIMDKLLKDKIQKAMDQYLEPGLQVVYTQMPFLDRSKRGKLKQFISLV